MKNNLSNITLFLSAVIFLFASAFSLNSKGSANHSEKITSEVYEIVDLEIGLNIPDHEESASTCTSGCCTCTFGSSGPNGCQNASYCGLTECRDSCDQTGGVLCGECTQCEDPTVPCEA